MMKGIVTSERSVSCQLSDRATAKTPTYVPNEATSWLNVVPSPLPSTDSVSVRVAHAVEGGRSRVSEPIGCTEPRSTVIVCGYPAPSLLSQ